MSKKVTSKNVKTTIHIWTVLISLIWKIAWPKIGERLGTPEIKAFGIGIWPITIPKIAATIIPIKIAPGTLAIIKKIVTTKPKIVIQTSGLFKEPTVTKVESLLLIKLPPWRPMKAINKPIPAEIAYLISLGMASIIISRTLNTVSKMKRIEATKTAAKAVCHFTCIPKQTV